MHDLLMICWVGVGFVWLVGAIYNAFRGPEVIKTSTNSTLQWVIALLITFAIQRIIPKHDWLSVVYHADWLNIIKNRTPQLIPGPRLIR